MAERITPYLRRQVMRLPLEDRAALMEELRVSLVIPPAEPDKRLTYLADKMREVSGIDPRRDARFREVVNARTLFVFVARREGYSQHCIGAFLGRDHSTVCHAEKQVKDFFALPEVYRDEINLYNKFVEAL